MKDHLIDKNKNKIKCHEYDIQCFSMESVLFCSIRTAAAVLALWISRSNCLLFPTGA